MGRNGESLKLLMTTTPASLTATASEKAGQQPDRSIATPSRQAAASQGGRSSAPSAYPTTRPLLLSATPTLPVVAPGGGKSRFTVPRRHTNAASAQQSHVTYPVMSPR